MRAPTGLAPRKPFSPGLAPGRARLLPPATVVAGSLLTALPIVAPFPLLPPFGLLMLLAWRLLAPGSLRPWAPALLGFVDDLVSGQPLGSAVLLWTLCFFLIDLADQRIMFRDVWHDWPLAAFAIAACLLAGRYIASPVGAHVDGVLSVQIVTSILMFPAAMRLCSWIDRQRSPA